MEKIVVIENKKIGDERGYFFEFFSYRTLEKLGIKDRFVQGNQSKSQKGVLRGLHFQEKHAQGKLIRVLNGRILDIVVDLRRDSKEFGKIFKIELSEENGKSIYIPKGFAHGFLSLEENTIIEYLCSDFYYKEHDSGIFWNDKDLNIDWEIEKNGIENLIISEKDRNQKSFREFIESGVVIE